MSLKVRRQATLAVSAALALALLAPSSPPATGQTGSSTTDVAGWPTRVATSVALVAEGIGDSYFPLDGNRGYDVRRYLFSVRYRPATGRLHGTTSVRLTAKRRLERLNLDLVLRAGEVTVRGRAASFDQGRHELTVRPQRAIRKGDTVTVGVRYGGRPARVRWAGESPFQRTATGAIALGEPHIATWWFPANDHPSDKARFDIRLTVPRGMQAISNGRLTGRTRSGDTTTWHWLPGKPMATYLAFAAFGRYDLERGRTALGPYLYAFERGLGRQARAARRSVRMTPAITRWLQSTFGRYPFADLGGVVPAADLGFALENQTRPVYARNMFYYGRYPSLIVHEMAHQWFGDKVAVRRWRHIWLNEGFATYAEWLWRAHRGGQRPNQRFLEIYDAFGGGSYYWRLPIGDPGPERLFDYAVYERGAMTLQALRNRVGSRDFFRIMRVWVRENRDGLGSTPEFRRLAERISEERLGGLFRAWLFSGEKPARTRANGF